MMNIRNYITATFTAGCFFLAGCENDPAAVNRLTQKNLKTEQAIDVELNYTTGGKIKAILRAPLMLRVQDTAAYYEFPKTLYTEFYNQQEVKESILTANYGRYSDLKNLIYLRDSVRIVNLLKGDTIFCEDLYWDRNRKNIEFYTDKNVRIRQRDGQYLNGTGMEASESFKDYHILNPVGEQNTKMGIRN